MSVNKEHIVISNVEFSTYLELIIGLIAEQLFFFNFVLPWHHFIKLVSKFFTVYGFCCSVFGLAPLIITLGLHQRLMKKYQLVHTYHLSKFQRLV